MNPALFQENERLAPQSEGRKLAQLGAMTLDCGAVLEEVVSAYETWGELNRDRTNAVLVCHALSGDSHAIGWWDRIVGPGRPIDTTKWFVIGQNCLGGCQGTTGPATLDEKGRRLGSRFPQVSVGDMVDLQARLLDHLGIEKLALVCGGSMGGMQALEWTVRHPERVEKCWAAASASRHSPMQIGFNEAARQAILRDPKWQGGDYRAEDPPAMGLAVARMLGHLTYLSPQAFEAKFGRRRQSPDSSQFAVESYLNYQGDKFTTRFDAGSLVVLMRAIDSYELASLANARCRMLFTSFTSDWIYPSSQSEELHEMALAAGLESAWQDIDLPYGHDAFLLDGEHQGAFVKTFLEG